jgi:hypothetical protein
MVSLAGVGVASASGGGGETTVAVCWAVFYLGALVNAVVDKVQS